MMTVEAFPLLPCKVSAAVIHPVAGQSTAAVLSAAAVDLDEAPAPVATLAAAAAAIFITAAVAAPAA